MRCMLVLSAGILCLAVSGGEVLFRTSFDGYSVKADKSVGSGISADFTEGLMLRMFKGPGDKGNAMLFSGDEKIRYSAKGNISPREGTISFWVAPQDWKATAEGIRDFVTVESKDFHVTIGKCHPWKLFGAYFTWDRAPTVSRQSFPCCFFDDKTWRDGEWHRFDLVWNVKGAYLFVDGYKPPSRRIDGVIDTNWDGTFASAWKKLPESLEEGTITLSGGQGGGTTAIDEFEIRDYAMGEQEIRDAYVKYYPLSDKAPPIKKPRPPRKADMTPYKVKAGVDRTVPAPWASIEMKGPKTFGVLLRDYTFGEGPFPVSVTSFGAEVLEKAPELVFETAKGSAPVKWNGFEVVERAKDRVTLKGRGEANGVVFGWIGQLWFDGAYRVELEGAPQAVEVQVKKMELKWSVPAEHSKYLLCNQGGRLGEVSVQWTNRYDRSFCTYRGETLLWLTGIRSGFFWWTESDRNCVHRKGTKPVHLVRTPTGAAEVTVEYINAEAVLKETANWNIVFDATPTRTPRPDYRDWRQGTYQPTKHQNALVIGWETFHDPLDDCDLTHCASHWPRDPEAYHRAVKKYHATGSGNTRCFAYNWPGAISDGEAEWDVFRDEWRMIPSRIQKESKNGVKWQLTQCCGHTGIADLACYRMERMMELYYKDGLRGVNYDICDVSQCENVEHGCGGTDAFGRTYRSSNAWNLRQFLMRIYKIVHHYEGGAVLNHAHNYFNPVCHSFTDVWTVGEQYNQGVTDNPKWFYQDDIPAYELECAWNPVIKGVGMFMHLMPPNYDHDYLRPGKHPDYSRRAFSRFLVHDVPIYAGRGDPLEADKWFAIIEKLHMPEAKFIGYWEKTCPKLVGDPMLEASLYVWKKPSPYRAMIIAANRAHEPRQGLLVPPMIPEDATFRDLWNDRPLTRQEVLDFEIPAGEFAAIGISYGPGK